MNKGVGTKKYGYRKTLSYVGGILKNGGYMRTPDEYGWFRMGVVMTLLFSSPVMIRLLLIGLVAAEFRAFCLGTVGVMLVVFGGFILRYCFHNVSITSRRLDAAMWRIFREEISFTGEYYELKHGKYRYYAGYPYWLTEKGRWKRWPHECLMFFYKCDSYGPEQYADLMDDIDVYLQDKQSGQQYIRLNWQILYVRINVEWGVYYRIDTAGLEQETKINDRLFEELAYIAERFCLEPLGADEYKRSVGDSYAYFRAGERIG